jgi:hypothetical protein
MDDHPGAEPEHGMDPIPAAASSGSGQAGERQLARWGGAAALGGVVFMLLAFAVVIGLDLPDASDAETLTDFADIETGRIFENLFYLASVVLFTLHVPVLYQLLKRAHWAAALFGAALSTIGLAIMAASSLLHVSTSPLADLYSDSSTPSEELPAIEYAWHGTQSVFDSMLATGLLLVPVGMVLFGVAMRRSRRFGPRLAGLAIGLGVIGAVGATVEVVDRALEFSAVSVLAIVVFHLATGWRTLHLGKSDDTSTSAGDQGTIGAPAR